MMSWHPDEEVNKAIVRLLDTLSNWERSTSRESLLVLVPAASDEPVLIADSGKPLGPAAGMSPALIVERVQLALEIHDDPSTTRFAE